MDSITVVAPIGAVTVRGMEVVAAAVVTGAISVMEEVVDSAVGETTVEETGETIMTVSVVVEMATKAETKVVATKEDSVVVAVQ